MPREQCLGRVHCRWSVSKEPRLASVAEADRMGGYEASRLPVGGVGTPREGSEPCGVLGKIRKLTRSDQRALSPLGSQVEALQVRAHSLSERIDAAMSGVRVESGISGGGKEPRGPKGQEGRW